MTESTEIARRPTGDLAPAQPPLQAILSNADALERLDVDKVRELAELHLKLEANEARKAFAACVRGMAQADLHPVALDMAATAHTNGANTPSLPQVNRDAAARAGAAWLFAVLLPGAAATERTCCGSA